MIDIRSCTMADMLTQCRSISGLSDLHVVPGRTAFVRVDGELQDSFPAPSVHDVQAFLQRVAGAEQLRAFNDPTEMTALRIGHSDPTYGRLRIQAKAHHHGLKLAARFLQDKPPSLHDLDLPDVLPTWMHRPSGLVLFCGITGTGKTTNQTGMVNYALGSTKPHVITLENPIEYLYDDDRVTQRELGRHFIAHSQGLYDAMADDPDIIMMGEILTRETAEAALQAAESGHLVLATVHTNGTMHASDRIVTMFSPGERDMARTILSQQLIGCVGSKLVKKTAGGRRAAVEVLVKTPAVAGAIQQGNTKAIRDAITNTRGHGMMSLEQHLALLVKRAEITLAEAKLAAEFPDEVRI